MVIKEISGLFDTVRTLFNLWWTRVYRLRSDLADEILKKFLDDDERSKAERFGKQKIFGWRWA
jgi:hypothetical protein